MKGFIDGYDFNNLEVMKYWAPPSSWSKEKKKNETYNRITSGDFLGAQKRDGALYVLLKDEDGNISLRGRSKSVSGEYIDKWDHLPHLIEWVNSIPNGTCLLGEVYWVGHEGSHNTTTVMNCLTKKAIERQKKDEDKLHYYIFDVLALNNKSMIDSPAEERFNSIEKIIDESIPCKYIEGAQYVRGEELWNLLGKILADGYEGIVITRDDAEYEPGKRPSKTTMKVKKEIADTIDAFVYDYELPTRLSDTTDIENWMFWENIKTGERFNAKLYTDYKKGDPIEPVTKKYFNNWAGSFIFGMYDGDKIKPVCKISGLTEEVLANFDKYKGKVAEISAMEILKNEDGSFSGLRHPKMVGWREDKKASECNWNNFYE